MNATLWGRVDELIDSAPGLADLRAHGLHLLAARLWRSRRRPIPAALVTDELHAVFTTHAARVVLEEIRAACEGPVVVMKGPVVAAEYPHPALRPYQDIDILVSDAPAAQAALIRAGFEPLRDLTRYRNVRHHLAPLRSPSVPLLVEVHSRPKWVDRLDAPSPDDLIARAQPARLGVDGILTLASSDHVLVLAAHLWAQDPLTRFLKVLDIAVMAEASDARELDSLARAWGVTRLWRATTAVVDALLCGGREPPVPLRLWGRGMATVRESTVWETHVGRCMAGFWIMPPRPALRSLQTSLGSFLRRQPDESWRAKLQRARRQMLRPSMRRSEHLLSLETGTRTESADRRAGGRRRGTRSQ